MSNLGTFLQYTFMYFLLMIGNVMYTQFFNLPELLNLPGSVDLHKINNCLYARQC